MVSVIIPTYNYAHYLTETLQSVKEQTYQDWECIIIDDESTDNTQEIVKEFMLIDKRFKYIYIENKGVSNARNVGIKASSGDLIQFLDGDDLLQSNKIKSQVEVFERSSSADIVYNSPRFFDDNDKHKLRSSLKGNKSDDWMPKLSAKGSKVISQLSKINFLVINSPLLKRSIIDKVGYFDESMEALEDWDFWMRCALADCYFYYNEIENSFPLVRSHQGSLSTQTKLMNNGHFIFLKHTLFHDNLSIKQGVIIFLKYIELFWDTFFAKFFFSTISISLFIASIILLPLYAFIKIIRFIKCL